LTEPDEIVGSAVRRPRGRRIRGLLLVILLGVLGGTTLVAATRPSDVPTVVAGPDGLVRDGERWPMRAGTVYGGLDDPVGSVQRIRDLGLNTVRITDFLDRPDPGPADAYDEAAWRRVDQLIAVAQDSGVAVLLDLSTYRNLLVRTGSNPYTTDWTPFLAFVVDRVNTRTGVRYGADRTIALVAFAGEPAAINGTDNVVGTSAEQLVDFYRNVEQFWRDRAPDQLLTTGGLLYLDWDSGIDWRSIMALPHNDVFTIHLYSSQDLRVTMPQVAEAATAAGRPWLVEEWGANALIGDDARAEQFWTSVGMAMTDGSAGFGFWNVGPGTHDTFDLGPQFPQVFRAIRTWSGWDGS